jgi:hypothetical protein
VWQEELAKSKNFLNRECLLNVAGTQEVRANHLKGESHQGLRRLAANYACE